MTIVVGYLATREGRAALDAAIAEAERRATGLLLVQSDKGGAGSADAASAQGSDLDQVRTELTDRGLTFDIREIAPGRDVAEELIAAAEESDGSLIVIGLRRRSPVGKLILGVNAQRILLDAPCPVLAVKPSGNGDGGSAVHPQ